MPARRSARCSRPGPPWGSIDAPRRRTFDLYAETASFSSNYSVEPSVGVDAARCPRLRLAAAAQAVIKPVVLARSCRTGAPGVRAAEGPTERVIVSVNASYLTASRTFGDTRTFDLYAETASFSSNYSVEPSVGVDAGGALVGGGLRLRF